MGWSLDGCPFALKNGFKAPRESKPTKAPKAKTFTPDTLQPAWACLQNRRSPPSDQLPHAVVHVRPPKGASHGWAYMRDTPSSHQQKWKCTDRFWKNTSLLARAPRTSMLPCVPLTSAPKLEGYLVVRAPLQEAPMCLNTSKQHPLCSTGGTAGRVNRFRPPPHPPPPGGLGADRPLACLALAPHLLLPHLSRQFWRLFQ